MSTKDGGPAFPTIAESVHLPHSGMSLRDWFAGMALQAIISKHPASRSYIWEDAGESEMANGAYYYADAMLAARKGVSDVQNA